MTWDSADHYLYPLSLEKMIVVASRLAKSIKNLIKLGLDPSRLTLIGFSLGAHVVGKAGEKVGKVQRVIGKNF